MTSCQGFDPVREQTLREVNSTARLYRHIKTGAELLSLINDDENKVFGITFRIPPRFNRHCTHSRAFGAVRITQIPPSLLCCTTPSAAVLG
jgi:hypothetical protein